MAYWRLLSHEGYGVLTLCGEILPTAIADVGNQTQHHDHGALDLRFEHDTHDEARAFSHAEPVRASFR